MGKRDSSAPSFSPIKGGILALALGLAGLTACTHHVQIEPSEKPFVVNLNVKIDHDIRVKVEDQNKDLLNLENEVLQKKPASKKGGKHS